VILTFSDFVSAFVTLLLFVAFCHMMSCRLKLQNSKLASRIIPVLNSHHKCVNIVRLSAAILNANSEFYEIKSKIKIEGQNFLCIHTTVGNKSVFLEVYCSLTSKNVLY
jgi:hypothetical protein